MPKIKGQSEKGEGAKNREKTPLVVRFGHEQASELERLSETMATSQAQLVRWAVAALIKKIHQANGSLKLPVSFDDEDSPLGPSGGSSSKGRAKKQ